MDLCSPVTWVSKVKGMSTVLWGEMIPQGLGLESNTAGEASFTWWERHARGVSKPPA